MTSEKFNRRKEIAQVSIYQCFCSIPQNQAVFKRAKYSNLKKAKRQPCLEKKLVFDLLTKERNLKISLITKFCRFSKQVYFFSGSPGINIDSESLQRWL